MAKQKVIFYLTDTTLAIQTEKKVLGSITFPEDLVKNKEVIDKEAFVAFLTGAFTKLANSISTGVIVVGKGLLYQVALPKDSDTETDKEAFYNAISFESAVHAELSIQTAEKEYILLTNRDFYQSIMTAAGKSDMGITAVVPLSLFVEEIDQPSLDKKEVVIIFKKEQLYAKANFLSLTPNTDTVGEKEAVEVPPSSEVSVDAAESIKEEQSDEIPSLADESTRQVYTRETTWNIGGLLFILGFLIIITLGFGWYLFGQQDKELFTFPSSPTPTPTASPATPTPTKVQAKAKGDLTIQVLNGTGTAGQAGEVQTVLEDAGYENVTTGNADASDNTKTTVAFSPQVAKEEQDEVVELLEETFSEVTQATDNRLTVDILITTGEVNE